MSYTTEQKIACVKREIAMRRRVYPGRVQDGRMKEEDSEREIGCMEAILQDMYRLHANENQYNLF